MWTNIKFLNKLYVCENMGMTIAKCTARFQPVPPPGVSPMYSRLREQVEICREDLLIFVERLVRTPSPSFHEGSAAKIVEEVFGDLGYDLVFEDEAGNVVGLLVGGEEGPTVLLNTHLDARRWEIDANGSADCPAARIEGGRIWGAGAADCKGGLASQIFAGYILDKTLPPLHGTLVVAATVAQEGNGAGLRRLIERTLPKLGVMPELAIIGEPTNLVVYNGHDGCADIDIRVTAPESDALLKAVEEIVQKLLGAQGTASGCSSLQLMDPVYDLDGSAPLGVLRVRCCVGPGEAVTDCVGAVKRTVLGCCDSSAGATLDIHVHSERRRFYTGEATEVLYWSRPWSSDASNPLIARAVDALAAAGWSQAAPSAWAAKRLRPFTAGGLLDAGYRIPTLCFGPGDESCAGTLQESVDLEAVVQAAFATAVMVHGTIGTPFSLSRPGPAVGSGSQGPGRPREA